MKKYILIMLLALAGLAGMAQTNEPLPSGAVQFSNQLWIVPSDSTIWTGDVFDGKFVNLGSWRKVDSLLALKADASDLSDFYTQSQIDAFLALKADASALDDFYTKLEVDGLLAGYVPTSRTVNGKALTGNITLQMADIPNLATTLADKADLSDLDGVLREGDNNSELNNDAGYVTAATAPVTSVNGKTGAVVIDKGDLGLGNVDNTSDANKPISTATQTALNAKENTSNKATSLTSPNNTTYPTTQAVATAIAAVPVNTYTASNGITQVGNDFRPVYGTTSGTIAQGNDSRINNGQTAFERGDYRQYGLGSLSVLINNMTEADDFSRPSSFIRAASSSNVPFSALGSGVHIPYSESRGAQLWFNLGASSVQYRTGTSNSVWSPVHTFWTSNNFNPSDYIPLTLRSAPNGVASLDGSGKVPTSQLPTTGMQYQGTWNAATNTPTLSNATGTEGYFYRVTTAGTQDLGSGNITFSVGDDVIHNGSVWQRAPSGTTSTNLALGTRTSTTMPITNSNGSGVTLPTRTSSYAGLMTPTDLSTLNSALQSESDPTVPSYVKSITSSNITNWNTAYGWGDPAGKYLNISGSVNGAAASYSDGLNANDFSTGLRYTGGSVTNNPGTGILLGGRAGSLTAGAQMHVSTGGDVRARGLAGGVFGPWRTMWHDGNFTPSNYLSTDNFTWSNLPGKPSTFTPSAHTHSGGDITSGTVPFARLPIGTTGSTVAAGNHTHTLSGDVTGGIGSTVIANSAITFAKIQDIGTNTIMGRVAAGSGSATALTPAQVRAMLNVANGATANTGTVTSVTAGAGLTGGEITASGTISANFGTASGTIAQGNDSRINNGQTAFGWGNPAGRFLSMGTGDAGSIPVENISFGTYYQSGVFRDGSSSTGLPWEPANTSGVVIQAGGGTSSSSAAIALSTGGSAYNAHMWFRNRPEQAWFEVWHSGNFTPSNYAQLGTGSTQVRNNSQLDARYLQSGDLPTVNNGTLTLATGTGLTGSASFTANQAGNASFTVSHASGYQGYTTTEANKLSGIAAGATANATNAQLRDRATHTGTQAISTVSGLQTALDGKQASITGAATTITGNNLTSNRALISNGSGKVAVSDITATELGRLDGVTSNVQAQIDNITSGGTIARLGSGYNEAKPNWGNDTTFMRFKNVHKVTTNITIPESWPNGSSRTETVTVDGVELGDAVIINGAWLVPGLIVNSRVSSNDTVEITIYNAGPATSFSTSNTVYVTVITNRVEYMTPVDF